MSNAAKLYFAMQRGLNTEAPLINFPDGCTTSEQNYELTVQGARRRRPGLALEASGESLDILSGYTAGDSVRVFDWENVASISSINFLVMQVGYYLYIFDDDNPVSTTLKSVVFDLRTYKVEEATDAQVAAHPLESAFGRGHLFLFGKYTAPVYIEYDPDADTFAISMISIRERDFVGNDDGYSNSSQPTTSVDSHNYNLTNRGWTDAAIASFLADQGKYPSKAMIPWLGLVRAAMGTGATESYNNDGERTFSPGKLAAEVFQDASAPQGHIIKDPFDTTVYDDGTAHQPILTWDILDMDNGPQTLIVTTTTAHGLVPTDEVEIVGLRAQYNTDPSYPILPFFTVDGTFTVNATPAADEFEITVNVNLSWPWFSWYDQYQSLGTVIGGSAPNPSGNVVDFRPKAGAFFAGRVWYGGIDTARLSGRLYFSQVIENDSQYAKCYQIADPTDERISDLVPSDGGVIVIPEASNILKLVPYASSLLVFASNGVWEIGPGDLGYFSATSYSVRKITDSGTVSAGSVVLLDNVPIFWSVTDIYMLEQDPRTGYLLPRNISERTINTFYNDIPLARRRECLGVYDDLRKRAVWMYNPDASGSFTKSLVFDSRLGAFTVNAFAGSETDYVAGIFVLKEAGETAKLKYIGIVDELLKIAEPSNYSDYTDFGISEPECFMVTGYDSLRAPASFKSAPVVWVFSGKTEIGYDVDLNPIRPSSTTMQSRWEWADDASAGRWGREQEVYRRQRTYVPVDSSDTFDDGVPVVVSKNKLRGKGRVLQLKFTAGTGKDSYILGWKTNFSRIEK